MLKINGEAVNVTIFPDQTSQVWQLSDRSFVLPVALVEWDFSSESEFLHLAQLKALLDEKRVDAELAIPYLPYARQDKEISNSTTFALHTFARLLNDLNFKQVHLIDPHSNAALQLIRNSSAIYPESIIKTLIKILRSEVICAPDKGAFDKYYPKFSEEIGLPWVKGDKLREHLTGRITNYDLHGDVSGKAVLIIDDICDGGATFVLLAEALQKAGAIAVHLFVTHGIFSKGLAPLHNAGINRIFTFKGEAVSIDSTVGYKSYEKKSNVTG